MPKKATNVIKRKDGRWEARFVKAINADGKRIYGSYNPLCRFCMSGQIVHLARVCYLMKSFTEQKIKDYQN